MNQRRSFQRRRGTNLGALFQREYVRWRKLTEQTNERCPVCKAPIRITPGTTTSDFSHAVPFCEAWTIFMLALGAENPRIED